MVRSTIQHRRYRRSTRPSCVAGRTRFFLCGHISSIPRRRKRFRNGSLSRALSAITRTGFWRGRPARWCRPTRIVASVVSASRMRGNLPVRFQKGWAPAMAPSFSSNRVFTRHPWVGNNRQKEDRRERNEKSGTESHEVDCIEERMKKREWTMPSKPESYGFARHRTPFSKSIQK